MKREPRSRNWIAWIAGLSRHARLRRAHFGVPLAALIFSAAAALGADFDVTPTLSLTEEYSTNVDLDPDDEAQSSWITGVTPGVRLRGEGSRATIGFDGGLTFRHQTDGDDEGLNLDPALSGVLDAELVEDRFFLEGGASVSRQTLNTEDTASTSDQQLVQVYRHSPSLRSRMGSVVVA